MSLESSACEADLEVVEDDSRVGRFEWNPLTGDWSWTDGLYRLYGYEPHSIEPTLERFLQHKDPRDMARIDAVFARCLAHGGPFSCYHRIIDARGKRKIVVVVGYGERDAEDSRTVLMHGFMVDVTASGEQETSAALQAALKNRAGIEQVKGAIMLVHGLEADAAFALLRSHSQVYNKKVAAIVADLLVAFATRPEEESVTRGELDQMLWDAAHRN
ncbi:MAG: PAS and ANTAR domain-containing protein [Nocardioidaceae bacterium]|jgi:hypothetical protein